MATVKFIIQSKKPNSTIYARFSVGVNQVYKRKTRETVNPENWNAKKGTIIQRTALGEIIELHPKHFPPFRNCSSAHIMFL